MRATISLCVSSVILTASRLHENVFQKHFSSQALKLGILFPAEVFYINQSFLYKQLKFMHPNEVKKLLSTQIKCHHIEVYGEDQRHYEALVVSTEFEGLMKIKRHRLIYQVLGDHMIADIHALTIKAMTPEEYQALTPNKA